MKKHRSKTPVAATTVPIPETPMPHRPRLGRWQKAAQKIKAASAAGQATRITIPKRSDTAQVKASLYRHLKAPGIVFHAWRAGDGLLDCWTTTTEPDELSSIRRRPSE